MRRLLRQVALAASALGAAGTLEAQQLQLRRTPTLNLMYYGSRPEYLTHHLARSYENSMGFHRRLFGYTPSEPVSILLTDWSDFGHGGTSTMPWNDVLLGIEPFAYTYDTMPTNERMNWLMHHELAHVVASDQAAARDRRFRRLFGGKVAPTRESPLSMVYSYLTVPRWYAPRWYQEGIATFLETWMAGGIGRSLGGYDEMVFRAMVLEDARFYDLVGLESEGTTIDFQTGQNAYLYGTRFVTWLAMSHSPEQVVAWFNRNEGSAPGFAAQYHRVFGTPLEDGWRRWVAWEREWQRANLARIRRHPVSRDAPVTAGPVGNLSRGWQDPKRGRLYAGATRPGKPAQILAVDLKTGAQTPLVEVVGPAFYLVTSLAFDPKGDKLFWTSHHLGWRSLHELDLASGRSRVLLRDCRIGDLAVSPADQAIWGVRHDNGISTVVRIPPPYTAWEPVLALDYGRDLLDLDLSPDGRSLAATAVEVDGSQRLVRLDVDALRRGGAVPETLHAFGDNSASNFVFSPDGRYLYGTSYQSGVSNLFRYDLGARRMEALSNAETGYFRPLPLADGGLLAYRYTARGFLPVRLPVQVVEDVEALHYLGQEVVERHPVVKTWNAGSPARVDLDAATTYLGPYPAGRLFRLASFYPVLEGYKRAVAAGLRFNFQDPAAVHSLDLTLAGSPGQGLEATERLHAKLAYRHPPWTVSLARNPSDFYDLFGPTRTSHRGNAAEVAYHDFWIFDRPRVFDYTVACAYYGDLDTVPGYQNVLATSKEYATLKLRMGFQDLRRTPGAVEDERGWRWTLAGSASRVQGDVFPRVHGTFDLGGLVLPSHSSLWLRTAAGKSWGDPANSFSRFFFGGFGNNYLDWQEPARYRRFDSFPGLELDEAGGNDFAKATLEWNLPPLRFRRLGAPGFYARWARLTLFGAWLGTDLARQDLRRNAVDGGAQVDVSLVLFSDLPSTLSFGWAAARRDGRTSREFMASLKVLR